MAPPPRLIMLRAAIREHRNTPVRLTDDLVPIGQRVVDRRVTQADAGAVDQDVDPAMVLRHGCEGALERGLVGNVGHMAEIAGPSARSPWRLLGGRGVAVEDRDWRPRRRAVAVARPIPRAPPVTTAILPSRRKAKGRLASGLLAEFMALSLILRTACRLLP